MALNFGTSIHHLKPMYNHFFSKLQSPSSSISLLLLPTNVPPSQSSASLVVTAVQSDGTAGSEGVTEEETAGRFIDAPSTRTQLDFLKRLTSTSSSDGYANDGDSSGKPTIRDQLCRLVGDREGEDFSIPLGKDLKKVSATFLTISQKRNIKRQAYLNNVSQRNDTNFFATIAGFVILPPILILVFAVLTGYIELFP